MQKSRIGRRAFLAVVIGVQKYNFIFTKKAKHYIIMLRFLMAYQWIDLTS